LIFLVLVAWFLFNWNSIPLFIGGSNAIVDMNEQSKHSTWFSFGVLSVCVSFLLVAFAYQKSNFLKLLLAFFIIFLALLPGKKSGLLNAVGMLLLVEFCFGAGRKNFPLFKVAFAGFLGIIYIGFQYARTLGISFDIHEVFLSIAELIYIHSTVYLRQFIDSGALSIAESYPKDAMTSGVLGYYLNPFYKVVFGTGIEKAVGPYVSNYLYGSGAGVTGANPTLFFELIFVSGTWFGSLLAFGIIPIWSIAMILIVNRLAMNFNKEISIIVFYLMMLGFMFYVVIDSLNAIRTVPFVALPLLIKYSKDFLRRV